jgi:hypothetical protein
MKNIENQISNAFPVKSIGDIDEAINDKNVNAVIIDELTDAIIDHLSNLRQIEIIIHSGNSKVDDLGLKTLSKMNWLRAIDLEWSDKITDDGIFFLKELKGLEWIDLSFCKNISKEAVEKLKAAIPSCEIEI